MKDDFYVKYDYHFLVVVSENKLLMCKCNGEIGFPCVKTLSKDVKPEEVSVRFDTVVDEDGHVYRFTEKDGKVFKRRHCGIKRLYYVVQLKNKPSSIVRHCSFVPIEEVLVNKPNVLDSNAKAIIKCLDETYKWSDKLLDKPKRSKRLKYSSAVISYE